MIRPNDFELLLMRHGQAQSWADGGDANRTLTESGAQAIARAAKAFVAMGWTWTKAWSSPFERTKQTSQIIWQTLHDANLTHPYELASPVHADELVVHADPYKTARFITKQGHALQGPRPCVAIFGHQPNLAAVASLLLSTEHVNISLGQGDIIHLFVPAPSPFDTILDPKEEEPLPKATLLGFYPRHSLERIGLTV